MKLHTIDTGFFKLDGGAMFGVVPKSLWSKQQPADELNLCTWAMRCLLIELPNRLILIDTGIGSKQDAKFFSHYHLHGDDTLDRSLKTKGFSRADITDVFLTHLHFDHVGGAIERVGDRYLPTFPHAQYWSNEAHWNWAVQPNAREKASFLKENIVPIQEHGQLRFVEQAGPQPFGADIDIRYMYGHTEAMMLPQIRYKEQTLVYMADLLPSVAHLPLPWVMSYDMFPLKTLSEKESFLNEAADKQYILYLEHDPKHECAILQHTEKGVRLAETFPLSNL
jgi:glyoxylase-like metal-dependent hydrolase (beta-lactamase superfamily II)